jgi:hypothetical protein
MPDDCTVLALHLVGRRADDLMDKDKLGCPQEIDMCVLYPFFYILHLLQKLMAVAFCYMVVHLLLGI